MCRIRWSLGLCALLTVTTIAATPAAQPGTAMPYDESIARLFPNRTSRFPTQMATNSSSANLSATSLTNRGPIRCFENPPPPARGIYRPIIASDYLGALFKIMVDDDTMGYLDWYFEPGERKTWCNEGCCIGVGTPASGRRTVLANFQPAVVAHLAAQVARDCLITGQNLGGWVSLGDYEELSVVVLGTLGTGLPSTAAS